MGSGLGNYFAALGDAAGTEWVGAWLFRQAQGAEFKADPNFALDSGRIGSLRDRWNLDDGQVRQLASAGSEDHLQLLVRQMNSVNEARQRLAMRGFAGTAASLTAMVTDPVALALDAATWGASAPLTRGAKAGRIAHLVRGGVAAGASGAAVETYLASVDSTRGMTDVILAATGGFAAGGVLGGAFGPRVQAALDKQMAGIRRQILTREIAEGRLAIEVTDKGKRLGFTEETTLDERRGVVSALLATGDDGVFRMAGSRPMFSIGDDLGGMDAGELDAVVKNIFADDLDDAYRKFGLGYSEFNPAEVPDDLGEVRFGKIRFGIAARLGQSPVPGMRRLGAMMVEDVIPRTGADGKPLPVNQAATMWVSRMHRTTMSQWQRGTMPLFEEHLSEIGAEAGALGRLDRYRLRNEFQEAVGREVIHENAKLGETAVQQAAMLYRAEMNRLRELGQRYGVKGFEELTEDPAYFTRMPAGEKIEDTIRRAGRREGMEPDYDAGLETVETMIAESMATGIRRAAIDSGDDLADDFLDSITTESMMRSARGYLREIRKVDDDGNYFARSKLFSGRLDEESEKILEEAGMSPQQITRIREAMASGADSNAAEMAAERGAPASGRRRTMLDESVSVKAPSGETITMDDLFERNATRVMEVYSRQVYGAAAASRIYQDFAKKFDTRVETFDDLMRVLDNQANDGRLSTADLGRYRSDRKRFEAAFRSMMNWRQPSNLDPSWGRGLQTLRDIQFMRLMGLSGFAQIAEMGVVMAEVGLPAMMQQMPALRRLFRRAKDGTLDPEILQVTEAMWGHATHRLRGRVNPRLDQTDAGFEYQTGALRELAARGKFAVADLSGMNAVNMMLKRMHEAGFVQRFANMAAGTTAKPSPARLAALGLTDEKFAAIAAQFRKHATTDRGELGGRVVNPNIEKWDANPRGWFVDAGDRAGLRAVQENDIGQMAAWMTTDVGQTLMQFKSFITAAYEKQLLFGVATHDARIFSAWAASTMFAGLAYAAKMQILAQGRSDRDEYLAERMSTRSIALNSFAYAGFASVLPGTIDTGLTLLGQDKLFDYGRSTGLASDFWAGNPVVDFVDKVAAMPQAVANMIGSGEITETDVNKLTQVLPGQNLILIGNMLKALGAAAGEEE